MGEFYGYNGNYGPSDSYLLDNPGLIFSYADGENDDYNVYEDEEALTTNHYCKECGAPYTLSELLLDFDTVLEDQYGLSNPRYSYARIEGLFNSDENFDVYCPDCAARRYAESLGWPDFPNEPWLHEYDPDEDEDDDSY